MTKVKYRTIEIEQHDRNIRIKERLAFADWLEEIRVDSFVRGHEFNKNKAISYLNRLIFKIDAKIKELKSNPLNLLEKASPKEQSVDGKGSEEK